MYAEHTLSDLEEEQVRRITGRSLPLIRRICWVSPGKIVTVQFGNDARSTYRVNLLEESAIRV